MSNGVILYYTVYCDEAIAETGSGTSGIGELLPDDHETTTSSVVTTVSGNETSAVVTGLTPYTFYDCYVTANTSIGEGHVSVVDSAQTDESGQSAHIHTHSHDYMTLPLFITTEPGDAPTNFNVAVVSSTAIRLTWSPPLLPYGVLISYTITYNVSDGNISTVVNTTNPRNYLIAHLEEHMWYTFELFASTSVGGGPYTTLTTRTDISGIYLL